MTVSADSSPAAVTFGNAILQVARLGALVALVTTAAWIVATAALEAMTANTPLACRDEPKPVQTESSDLP